MFKTGAPRKARAQHADSEHDARNAKATGENASERATCNAHELRTKCGIQARCAGAQCKHDAQTRSSSMHRANANCKCYMRTHVTNAECKNERRKCDVQMCSASMMRTQSASATKHKLDNSQSTTRKRAAQCTNSRTWHVLRAVDDKRLS